MSALDDIAAERIRQLDEKGYDAEHDDAHPHGEIAQAAAALAMPGWWGKTGGAHGGRREREELWPDGVGDWNPRDDRRDELVRAGAMLAAEIDRLDRGKVGVPQAYLPKAACWERRPIQCAISIRAELLEFLKRHPRLRVFSGLRVGATGDHRCGYATDLVPLDYSDKGDIVNASTDATLMVHRGLVAYVEPLEDTWIPGNHHLHVSWKRCP